MSISRRTLIASGGAWAVPVIVVGAAAPAVAASPRPPVIDPTPVAGCKRPGQSQSVAWGYEITLRVTASQADVLTFTSVTAPGDPGAVLLAPTGSVVLAPGENLVKVTLGASNSANGTATITFAGLGGTGTVTVAFGDFRPCKD